MCKIYELYFDESGNFEEHALLEDGIERREMPQPGASQLVGILAPTHIISPTTSESLLAAAHQKAGLSLERECHATKLISHGQQRQYSILLEEFLVQMERSSFQPVRLCNNARIGFGDKITTYTSMVAELVVRIFEELTCEHGNGRIEVNIVAARVRTNGHEKNAPQIFIDEGEYTRRLVEQIAFAAVRRGVAHNRSNWIIGSFRFGSGLKDRPLQVCDLLSNASYRNFRNCSTDQKHRLKALVGNYDFMLNRSEVLEEIDHHRQDGSLAHAVQTIAENWNRPELDQSVRQNIKEQCTSIVSQLAAMPTSARNIYLRQLSDWGNQFLVVRDLNLVDQILRWLEKQVAEPLCMIENPIREDVHWFLAQLLVLRLGEHNHRGELAVARNICDRLKELLPVLAGQWEHASLLTQAMTLRAVHLNDCYEYEEASLIMGSVERFYGSLSSLMADALPGVFPERVRSKHRGMALGTQLQSEMFAGLSDRIRLDNARRLNEMAIDEFSSENDQRRQFQYRCQMETYAGNLSDARVWLAKSLGIESESHNQIAETIKTLEGIAQGFALLHWSRIGMEAGRMGLQDELKLFLEAIKYNKLDVSPWVKQQGQEYPAHGIRRHLAVAYAHASMGKLSQEMINSLRQLDAAKKEPLELIKLVGCAEAASLWGNDNVQVIKKLFLEPSTKSKPFLADLNQFESTTGIYPALNGIASRLNNACNAYVTSGWNDHNEILSVCRLVGQ